MPQTVYERWLLRAVILVVGGGSALMGAGMILGGPPRFVNPSFATARLVPGGVYAWGLLLLAAGAVTVAGAWTWRRALLQAGTAAMAGWYLFFDVSLIHTSWTDPHGAVTGAHVDATMTALCLLLWAVARDQRIVPGRSAR